MIREKMTLEQLEKQIQKLPRRSQLKLAAQITKRSSTRTKQRARDEKRDKFARDFEKIKHEQDWWMAQPETERLKYAGEYIAVHNHELVDHDADTLALSRRIRARFGKMAVLMMPAEGPREIRIYSTRLVRDEN